MQRLLSKMPSDVAQSFSQKQLMAIRQATIGRSDRIHNIDIRSTLALPFLPYRFYLVFLMGRDRRELTAAERVMAGTALLFGLTVFVTGLLLLVFLVAYLVKSALGINLFEDTSLGIWDWFKANVLS